MAKHGEAQRDLTAIELHLMRAIWAGRTTTREIFDTIAESGNYAYGKSANAIFVNLYGGSTLTTTLGGTTVRLTQETEYPWNGRIRITVNECSDERFALKLRIPGWAKSAVVRINGGPAERLGAPASRRRVGLSLTQEPAGETPALPGYAELLRVWQPGDFVDLDLPMPTQLIR